MANIGKILNCSINDQQETFTKCKLKYFSQLIRDARRSYQAKVEGAKTKYRMFGDRLSDIDFQLWLVGALRLNDRDELMMFLSFSNEDQSSLTQRGRKFLCLEDRNSVYNFWLVNSEISVYRSNGRHLVNISPDNQLHQVSDIIDPPNISVEQTKRGEKLQAHKRIIVVSYKSLHENFKKLYNSTISYGSFINLKPFYIARITEKETEMCLCSKCLNPHCLYKAIRSTIEYNILLSSLSEYLCKGFKCDPEINTHYHTRECILGKCVNKCKITGIEKDLENESASSSKKVRYYVFETVVTQYYNKKGKLVSYNSYNS